MELKRKTLNIKGKRIGRGGKRGTTAGRGTKGQIARSGHKVRPEIRDILKKIPKRRGHGKNRARGLGEIIRYQAINLSALETAFEKGAVVTPAALFDKGMIRRKDGLFQQVKILGTGTLSKALTIKGCELSASAKEAVTKAGGTF